MIRSVILICLFVAFAKGQRTEVNQCIMNGGQLPINTLIDGCITPPCEFRQLEDAIINIIFRAPRMIKEMRTLATAYLLFLPVNYDLEENAIACNFLSNAFCPLLEGEVVQYRLIMPIERTFPAGTAVTVEFRIVDDNNVPFVCIRVPIRILPAIEGRQDSRNSSLTVNV